MVRLILHISRKQGVIFLSNLIKNSDTMLSEVTLAIIILIPLLVLIAITIYSGYWQDYQKSRDIDIGFKANYSKLFFLLIFGTIIMWVTWLGSIIFLFLNVFMKAPTYHSIAFE